MSNVLVIRPVASALLFKSELAFIKTLNARGLWTIMIWKNAMEWPAKYGFTVPET